MNNKGESMKYKVKINLTLEDEKLTDSMAATQAQRIKIIYVKRFLLVRL